MAMPATCCSSNGSGSSLRAAGFGHDREDQRKLQLFAAPCPDPVRGAAGQLPEHIVVPVAHIDRPDPPHDPLARTIFQLVTEEN